jgi:hypothetical protein
LTKGWWGFAEKPHHAMGRSKIVIRNSVLGALFFANQIVVVRNRQTTTFDLRSGLIFGYDAE